MIRCGVGGFVDAFEKLVDGKSVSDPEKSVKPLKSEWKYVYINRISLARLYARKQLIRTGYPTIDEQELLIGSHSYMSLLKGIGNRVTCRRICRCCHCRIVSCQRSWCASSNRGMFVECRTNKTAILLMETALRPNDGWQPHCAIQSPSLIGDSFRRSHLARLRWEEKKIKIRGLTA